MKYHLRKNVAAMLALLLLLASCGGETEETAAETAGETMPVETAPETEETRPALGIPEDVDYEGATVTFEAVNQQGGVTTPVYNPFSLEETTGELLNDMVYTAIANVEERLHVDLVQAFSNDVWDYGRLKQHSIAGDGSIDAFSYIDRFGTNQAAGGYVIPYNKIPNIDMSKPWWFQEVNKEISIAGQFCFAIGAMNLDVVANMQTMLYNKTLLADLGMDSPVELVRDGKWTIDALYGMMENATIDADGDGEMTIADTWGAVYTHDVWYNNFGPVSGIYIVEKDADDLPVFDVASNEPLITIWETLLRNFGMNTAFYIDVAADGGDYNEGNNPYVTALNMFRDGKALFSSSPSLAQIASLRDMEDDFGILPFPHMNEETPGTKYGSYVNGIGQPYFVPTSNSDPGRTGHVFEAMSYEYYYNVIDSYLEDVAMRKQIRDEESVEMLTMMYQNKRVDISSGYWWEDTNAEMYNVFRSGENTFVSTYRGLTEKTNLKIAETVKMFQSFETFGE